VDETAIEHGKLMTAIVLAAFVVGAHGVLGQTPTAPAAPTAPSATFRSSVDLVRVTAVVRDHKGRFVQDLTARDFEVTDGGQSRPITDFRQDIAGVSIALLFDVSGSMEAQFGMAREAAKHVLSWLDVTQDEAGVFRFDTRLEETTPFTSGLRALPSALSSVTPFGATSLLDAVARTSERVAVREGRRRAVVVFTDGNDNASRLTPAEVSGIASAIDVPVYVVGVVAEIDNPSSDIAPGSDHSPLAGALADVANWTGGHVFVVSSPAQRSMAARQIVEELRHQYLIAFESSGEPGWHRLAVRVRNKNMVVRTRSGYIAGQSRPNSL
jgi:Ca-activated chloride channel family protein